MTDQTRTPGPDRRSGAVELIAALTVLWLIVSVASLHSVLDGRIATVEALQLAWPSLVVCTVGGPLLIATVAAWVRLSKTAGVYYVLAVAGTAACYWVPQQNVL